MKKTVYGYTTRNNQLPGYFNSAGIRVFEKIMNTLCDWKVETNYT